MLTIENLNVSYDKQWVLRNLSLQLNLSKIHGLVGLNGAGKTTLLNTIYEFVTPQSGKILLNNQKLKRKEIAYLETQNYFYSNITGKEYLQLFQGNKKQFQETLWQELLQLPLDELIENYSTGMKKKLAILAILKLDKQILILDEPFNGLDIETCHILKLVIQKLNELGKTIIITSHIFETLINTCDSIHYLANGSIEKSYEKSDFTQLQNKLYETIENNVGKLINEIL